VAHASHTAAEASRLNVCEEALAARKPSTWRSCSSPSSSSRRRTTCTRGNGLLAVEGQFEPELGARRFKQLNSGAVGLPNVPGFKRIRRSAQALGCRCIAFLLSLIGKPAQMDDRAFHVILKLVSVLGRDDPHEGEVTASVVDEFYVIHNFMLPQDEAGTCLH